MFRGTTIENDGRFGGERRRKKNAEAGPACFKTKLDLKNVLWDSIGRWIELRTTALLEGVEDEILVGFITESLTADPKNVDPWQLSADLEGFLGDKAQAFVEELWKLLIDASSNEAGVPKAFVSTAKEERRREDRWHDGRQRYAYQQEDRRKDVRHKGNRRAGASDGVHVGYDNHRRRHRSRSPHTRQDHRRKSRETYLEMKEDVIVKDEGVKKEEPEE